jgi:hypothetical protein
MLRVGSQRFLSFAPSPLSLFPPPQYSFSCGSEPVK